MYLSPGETLSEEPSYHIQSEIVRVDPTGSIEDVIIGLTRIGPYSSSWLDLLLRPDNLVDIFEI